MEEKNNDTNINTFDMAIVEIGSPLVRIRARGRFSDKDAADFVPTPESAHFYIDIPCYDGPLDLLLHLIKKHSMDIFDIPIVTITQKYLEAISLMEELNLDVAGEFILMAATLAEIKSKMLLPKEERTTEGDEDEESADPRAELLKRLLLYKSFKEASEELHQRPKLGRDLFYRPRVLDESDQDKNDLDISQVELASFEIYDLLENLSRLLKSTKKRTVHTITRDRISVSARIHELIDYCRLRPKFNFYDALNFFPIYEKADVIVTFLALLEMAKLKLITIVPSSTKDLELAINKENFYTSWKEASNNIEATKEQVKYGQ